MKKTFTKKRSAFSLIELSIVLIIIGLLIAGVTGGASLIKSSELRSVMGEARGYSVAVNAFYTQYNALPGDFNSTLAYGTAGNSNNYIKYYDGMLSESANAWMQLKAIGAIDSITGTTLVSATTAGPVYGITAPASKIKSSGWIFSTISVDGTKNYVVLTGAVIPASAAAEADTLATGALAPADALSIDSKIDDGLAISGRVIGNVITAGNDATTDATTCYNTATATYAARTEKTCAIAYQVDVNS
jgi:prepilin-type N-terminal cleavage/methylation domain-containing protein